MRAAILARPRPPPLRCPCINGPSASQFWVQNISNTISWSFSQGDPSPVDIIVTNGDNRTLNGDFSIARFVNVSQETFTVTNVTLLTGTGYQVVFINPINSTQVYANSSDFEVKAPGTPPAPTSSASTPTSSSTSGNSSASSTSAGPSGSSTAKKNGAAAPLSARASTAGLLACGAVALSALFL
ncbi:hypothetical protein BC834DRAFT_846706 [Gloeopeniophorella convolvens]|nr:hypothetical protein BC834DRAFT_846706 [Gloeopeniophorella convolvens]